MSDVTLGLDVGTTSIGWALVDKEACRMIDAGVRIFNNGREPKGGASLAVNRREKRGQRRSRDRYLKRRKRLSQFLVHYGFLPTRTSEENKRLFKEDPYYLRFKALDATITPFEMGRIIFHLNQRRGFRSNRKADRGDDKESGKIALGGKELKRKMTEDGSRTLGEYLYKRPSRDSKRARMDSRNQYPFYPQRSDIEHEFDTLWEKQKGYRPDQYTDQAYHAIKDALFHQRPLRPVDPGYCLFVPQEHRLAKAHPLFQQLRLYEEVNALRVMRPGQDGRNLTREERDTLIEKLSTKKEMTFTSLRKALKLGADDTFNKETHNRNKLLGDEVRALLSNKKCFGTAWNHWDWEKQASIIELLEDTKKSDGQVKEELHQLDPSLDADQIHAIMNASLPEGYGSLGLTATKRILEQLKEHVIVYSDAVNRSGWNHSDFNTGEILEELPYYGEILQRDLGTGSFQENDPVEVRFGRIPNPTVHIGLRQVGKLVNAVIKRYGKPDHIAVELARELPMGQKRRADFDSRLRQNTKDAEKRGQALVETFHQTNNGKNRARLKLWEEQTRKKGGQHFCPYCGGTIGAHSLFSPEIEEDHILPFSRTLDNSMANRVVSHKKCNQLKKNRSPFEAFGRDQEAWDIIADSAISLPYNKQWRFTPDAMERFEGEGDFIARQLTDTQYLSKMVAKYLKALYPDRYHEAVLVSPGHMTALLRRNWGLDSLLWDIDGHSFEEVEEATPKHLLIKEKNRNDHRHHAIDAAVVALTDRSSLQWISRAAKTAEDEELEKLMTELEVPWEHFRHDLKEVIDNIVVSFKPNHGITGKGVPSHDQTSGGLLDETAFGAVDQDYFTRQAQENPGQPVTLDVVTRIPRENIDRALLDDSKGTYIVDDALRETLKDVTEGKTGKAFDEAIADFFTSGHHQDPWHGLRHVRVQRQRSIIPICRKADGDKERVPYKGYVGNSNSCYEVWQVPDPKKGGTKWDVVVVSEFQQNTTGDVPTKPMPTAKLVMRLFKNDMVAVEQEGERRIMKVVKFAQSKAVHLAEHKEANADARNRDQQDSYKLTQFFASSLKKNEARKLRVDILGKVYDPGFVSL